MSTKDMYKQPSLNDFFNDSSSQSDVAAEMREIKKDSKEYKRSQTFKTPNDYNINVLNADNQT